MLLKGMYVRFPKSIKEFDFPRDFLIGQVTDYNRINGMVSIKCHDPFGYSKYFDFVQKEYIVPENVVHRCQVYSNAIVEYKKGKYTVLSCIEGNLFNEYYLRKNDDKSIICKEESEFKVPFNCSYVSPLSQLLNYEFQNPCWYIGHSVVSKNMTVLENSISGFMELAGCKINLMPHQLTTILRCLQGSKCRYMLADEVGMGKTIEALGVLKVFFSKRANTKALIVVPVALKQQWKTEMLFKFDLGNKNSSNSIQLITRDELTTLKVVSYDFLIVDEVHNYIGDSENYKIVKEISRKSENVLLLSATPIQERGEEYLKLVTLLDPDKYDRTDINDFLKIVDVQKKIVKSVNDLYGLLEDLKEAYQDAKESEENPIDNEDVQDTFEEIIDRFDRLAILLKDEKIADAIEDLSIDDYENSIASIQALLIYIPSTYQIAANVIRNRRKMMKDNNVGRELEKIVYSIDNPHNKYELLVYDQLLEWIETLELSKDDYKTYVIPLIRSYFSSVYAFGRCLKSMNRFTTDSQLLSYVEDWKKYEKDVRRNIIDVMDDEESYSSRIIPVLNFLNGVGKEKVVLFTDFDETLKYYQECLNEYFGEECVAVYKEGMKTDDRELSVYRFQTDDTCQFLLCDSSGGEGKNFQIAKYIVHLDVPWNVTELEQRIGRLDRIGRDPEMPTVSVVIYDENTLEETIVKIFNEGLSLFTQSISGLEIVMGELEEIIISSLMDSLQYGLEDSFEKVLKITETIVEGIKTEQIFDIAGHENKNLNIKINKLLTNLNQNDESILSESLMSWAGLTGFTPSRKRNNTVGFSRYRFSVNSAINTLLIPPNWDTYASDERSMIINHIQEISGEEKGSATNSEWLVGTFNRQQAVQNDFLHFFAPGDPIFDCIVNNAMTSYKGKCTAMYLECGIDWKGIIYSYQLKPDMNKLYEANISEERISQFLGYLARSSAKVPVGIGSSQKVPGALVLRQFNGFMNPRYIHSKFVRHLGRRSKKEAIMEAKLNSLSNMEWFVWQYPEKEWKDLVNNTYEFATNLIAKSYQQKAMLDQAKEEMDMIVASKKYSGIYKSDAEMEQEKREMNLILEALENAEIILDSAAFVWMHKD